MRQMIQSIHGILLLLMGAAGVGCSSGEGSSGSGTGCASLCQAAQELACPNEDDFGTCTTQCEQAFAPAGGQCTAEANALLNCAAGLPLQCNATGKAGYVGGSGAIQSACSAEYDGLAVCGACVVTDQNDDCTKCRKQSCCSQLKAFGSASDLEGFRSCIQSCGTTSCLDNCKSQYPAAGQAFDAMSSCESASCPVCS